MDTTLKLQQNAKVFVSSGEEIGHISRVVMQPETKEVTHIVVRMKSLLKKEEKLVPLEQISVTTESHINLRCTAEELEALPPFEEKHYMPSEGSTPGTSSSGLSSSVYGRPIGDFSVHAPSSGDKFIAKIEQNIPEGAVAVEQGANVISEDGKHVGKVEQIVAELPDDQATHLLVSKGLIAEEKRLIPFNWVRRIGEKEIHLGVKEDTVEELTTMSAESSG